MGGVPDPGFDRFELGVLKQLDLPELLSLCYRWRSFSVQVIVLTVTVDPKRSTVRWATPFVVISEPRSYASVRLPSVLSLKYLYRPTAQSQSGLRRRVSEDGKGTCESGH